MSTKFRSIWHIEKILPGATSSGQSEHWNNGNKGIIRVPQSSSITEI